MANSIYFSDIGHLLQAMNNLLCDLQLGHCVEAGSHSYSVTWRPSFPDSLTQETEGQHMEHLRF